MTRRAQEFLRGLMRVLRRALILILISFLFGIVSELRIFCRVL